VSRQVAHFGDDLSAALRAEPLSPTARRALEALIATLGELLGEPPGDSLATQYL
jgi:hypothetical protein